MLRPAVRPAIFSCTASSTFRPASLIAAVTRSWSISTSSLLTTSGSMRRLFSPLWPSMTTVIMPPPELASISRAAISCWTRSCFCWSCFMSFCGFMEALSYLRGGTHTRRDGCSRPPLKPPTAAPPLRGAALLVRLALRFPHIHDAAAEEVERLLHGRLARGLLEQPLALALRRRRLRLRSRRRAGRRRGRGHDLQLQRAARGLARQLAVLVRVLVGEPEEVGSELQDEHGALLAGARGTQRRRQRGTCLGLGHHRLQDRIRAAGQGHGHRRRSGRGGDRRRHDRSGR